MQMTCGQRACADDVYVTMGVVLHEIRQLRQEEGSHLEQLCVKPIGLLVKNSIYCMNLKAINN